MYGAYVTRKLVFAVIQPVTSEYVSTFRGKKTYMNYLRGYYKQTESKLPLPPCN